MSKKVFLRLAPGRSSFSDASTKVTLKNDVPAEVSSKAFNSSKALKKAVGNGWLKTITEDEYNSLIEMNNASKLESLKTANLEGKKLSGSSLILLEKLEKGKVEKPKEAKELEETEDDDELEDVDLSTLSLPELKAHLIGLLDEEAEDFKETKEKINGFKKTEKLLEFWKEEVEETEE